jgi:hypothetical protein
MLGSVVNALAFVMLAAVLVFFVDIGIADGVCGKESRMLWVRVMLPEGRNLLSVRGEPARALYNCVQTIHHSLAFEGIPPIIANGMKDAPFPGMFTRCSNLTQAHPPLGVNSYYYAYWLVPPSVTDSLCPAVV